jgi:hypothetical protein
MALRPLLGLAAALLLLAIPHTWPYGYYVLLRLVVCAVSLFGAIVAHRHRQGLLALFVLIALLFNPILPVHLTKQLWSFINLAVAVFFVATALMLGKGEGSERRLGGK